MMIRSIPTVLASLLLLGAANLVLAADEPAQVATLSKAQGTVMVDKGKGFLSSKADTPLGEGDRVITLEGSGAEIVFQDGCRTQLKANNMITVALNPGCKAVIVAVNGASMTTGGSIAASSPAFAGGAAATVLATGTAYLWANGGNDNTPISSQ